MSMGAVSNAWKAVRPHIPLIKFRKGAPVLSDAIPPPPVAAAPVVAMRAPPPPSPAPVPPPPVTKKAQSGHVLEEWEVPYRYRRTPLTEEEIDFINRGGPA